MEKVKVTRYMTGKRPDWAPEEFDSDEELNIRAKSIKIKVPGKIEKEKQESDVSWLFKFSSFGIYFSYTGGGRCKVQRGAVYKVQGFENFSEKGQL